MNRRSLIGALCASFLALIGIKAAPAAELEVKVIEPRLRFRFKLHTDGCFRLIECHDTKPGDRLIDITVRGDELVVCDAWTAIRPVREGYSCLPVSNLLYEGVQYLPYNDPRRGRHA